MEQNINHLHQRHHRDIDLVDVPIDEELQLRSDVYMLQINDNLFPNHKNDIE